MLQSYYVYSVIANSLPPRCLFTFAKNDQIPLPKLLPHTSSPTCSGISYHFKCTACITFKCTATGRPCSGIQCCILVTKNAVLLLPFLLYSCFRKCCTVVTKKSETTNLQANTLYTVRSAYQWIPPIHWHVQ